MNLQTRQNANVQTTNPVCHWNGSFTTAIPRNKNMMQSLVELKKRKMLFISIDFEAVGVNVT